MDFTFTEEQQAVVEAAKAVFSGVEPDGVPSPALTPGAVAEDIDRAVWAGLAAGDLLGLTLAPEHGAAPGSTWSLSVWSCANRRRCSPECRCWRPARSQ